MRVMSVPNVPARERDARSPLLRLISVLRVARCSARTTRAQSSTRTRRLISTGPEAVSLELREPSIYQILDRGASSYRPEAARRELIAERMLRELARKL